MNFEIEIFGGKVDINQIKEEREREMYAYIAVSSYLVLNLHVSFLMVIM